MKKFLTIIIGLGFYLSGKSQCTIPNGDFENWTILHSSYDYPNDWSESIFINILTRFNTGDGFFYKYQESDAIGTSSLLLKREEKELNQGFIRFACDSTPNKLVGKYKFSGSSDTTENDELMVVFYLVEAADTVTPVQLHQGNDPSTSKKFITSVPQDTFTDFEIDLSDFVASGIKYDYAVIQLVLRGQYAGSTSSANAVIDELQFQYGTAIPDTSLTSIENKYSDKTKIMVYPNPVQHQVFIQNQTNENIETIKLFDAIGQMVYHKNYIEKRTPSINISHLPKGVYMLNITTSKGAVYIEKIIKN